MAPVWSYQPLKGLLTAYILGISPLYFSLPSIYYIPKRLRPHPNWSIRTSLGRAFYYQLFKYATMIRLAPQYAVKSNDLKDRFVMVKPSSSDLYTGILKHPIIKPSRKFVLYLPGGAYVFATIPSKAGVFPSTLFEKGMDAITFFGQYRVAATPETRFPAAIQDAVTFYLYLLDLGIPAKNIIVSGDSAGGHLVLALLRYIEDSKTLLPRPRGAISWSPWVNMTASAMLAYKKSPNNSTDLVPYTILEWGIEAYPPPSDESSSQVQAYLSPALYPFATKTPLLLQAGSVEVFHADIRAFAQDMAAMPGSRVKYHETADAPHDLSLCGGTLGLEKEAVDVIKVADGFFDT
ncbi:alpha/beta-hydrolase [Byssothecium circinans]|uniref:Alpha/beta-hydrolase n=1 Tax=Byssothecium circinans TaxID=147558 RepID=A0A6A5TPI2_9PLEO|nr:alpha/beta-hydrolase [Byssothecium circinans]